MPKMRYAERVLWRKLSQLPPRITRREPVAGPVGFVTGPAGYVPSYQSSAHSNKFPLRRQNSVAVCNRLIPCDLA